MKQSLGVFNKFAPLQLSAWAHFAIEGTLSWSYVIMRCKDQQIELCSYSTSNLSSYGLPISSDPRGVMQKEMKPASYLHIVYQACFCFQRFTTWICLRCLEKIQQTKRPFGKAKKYIKNKNEQAKPGHFCCWSNFLFCCSAHLICHATKATRVNAVLGFLLASRVFNHTPSEECSTGLQTNRTRRRKRIHVTPRCKVTGVVNFEYL